MSLVVVDVVAADGDADGEETKGGTDFLAKAKQAKWAKNNDGLFFLPTFPSFPSLCCDLFSPEVSEAETGSRDLVPLRSHCSRSSQLARSKYVDCSTRPRRRPQPRLREEPDVSKQTPNINKKYRTMFSHR